MAPPTKLAHIVLRTGRLSQMVDWYCDVLEARVAFRNEMLAFITYDDEHHRVAFVAATSTVAPTEGHSGLHHAAFTYDTMSDLLETYERLDEHGIEPYWCVDHGPTTSMYYEDPDQNSIELQVENFETPSQLEEFFQSGRFDANPIGLTFDPDDLMVQHKLTKAAEVAR